AGLKHSVVEKKYPQMKVPVHSSVYEQESMLEFRYRAEYMLSKLMSENDDENTLAVVTHGGMINQLYKAFYKLPVEAEFTFFTGDAGIHEWIIKENSRILVKANFIPHNI
ncbi:MAG: histidine phosphatase family protein, partial [Lachnospiraceae bacterium]|nr:histidine phosphatase family protein [Lachnospiraceae bacterium]